MGFQPPQLRENEDGQFPNERGDGWWEIKLGEFYNGGGDGEVEMSVVEMNGSHQKAGLIVQAIEIKPKRG